jgi:hypothetical protein
MKNNYLYNIILPGFIIILISAYIVMLSSGYIREGFQQKYSLEYYYMDGCGHCVDFNKSGVWDKVSENNWANVTVRKYNMKEQRDRVNKFKITGFPSIVIIDISGNEEVVVESFNKERTYENIKNFISKYT